MSDNVTTASGSIISADDVGSGVKVQRVKVQYGADGAASDVTGSPAGGLPVQVFSSDTGGTLLDASVARTATGVGADWVKHAKGGTFMMDVTAVSGTSPSLVFRVQQSIDGTGWYDLDATSAATAAITTTGQRVLRVYPGMPQATNASCNCVLTYHTRIGWYISGTSPSFTFSTWYVPHYL